MIANTSCRAKKPHSKRIAGNRIPGPAARPQTPLAVENSVGKLTARSGRIRAPNVQPPGKRAWRTPTPTVFAPRGAGDSPSTKVGGLFAFLGSAAIGAHAAFSVLIVTDARIWRIGSTMKIQFLLRLRASRSHYLARPSLALKR